ncbi:MAG: GAP family protein [Solirubrobacterales bacterium]|nr:GAP family protein [Solirubrobacterales bacterium]MBV9165083.1 GAP family protein [Solirubrobacterales bacterium]MBV9535256.1 GAP family protein [Solirubrobacterales bacterium]
MLRLVAVVCSIGLADSLNPSTIAPALYLASGPHPRRQVFQFTVGVFSVYLLGGLIIDFGPGHLLLALVPHPHHRVAFILELVAGVAMITAGVFLWGYRRQLAARSMPTPKATGRSSILLGAGIMVFELPTAFPYFAAIATIVGSDVGPIRQIILLVLFNICFVLPLIAILVTLRIAGPRADAILTRARAKLEAHWPKVLAAVALLAGVFVTLLGATGLAGLGHGHLGQLARRLRHRLLHP